MIELLILKKIESIENYNLFNYEYILSCFYITYWSGCWIVGNSLPQIIGGHVDTY